MFVRVLAKQMERVKDKEKSRQKKKRRNDKHTDRLIGMKTH